MKPALGPRRWGLCPSFRQASGDPRASASSSAKGTHPEGGPLGELERMYVKYLVVCPEVGCGMLSSQTGALYPWQSFDSARGLPFPVSWIQIGSCPVASSVRSALPSRMASMKGGGYYCVRLHVKPGRLASGASYKKVLFFREQPVIHSRSGIMNGLDEWVNSLRKETPLRGNCSG